MSRPIIRQPGKSGGYIERICYQMIVIVGLALLLAGANMLVNPNSPKYGEGELREGEIRLADVSKNTTLIWVDARDAEDYDQGHVKGALNVNEHLYYMQVAKFLDKFDGTQTVLVYCSNEGCDSAQWVAERLRKETTARTIYVIYKGWDAIKVSKLELDGAAYK